jgi:GNAT superfamily N-acetyltransferase
MTVTISQAPADFSRWHELLQLLHAAFAYQHSRIDPPSSLLKFNVESLAAKASEEALFIAVDSDELVGCGFATPKGKAMYVGKFAVLPQRQGHGIGARLLREMELFAQRQGIEFLELETRIELNENHAAFRALGFVKISEGAHPGYDRSTFVTMRKRLSDVKPHA